MIALNDEVREEYEQHRPTGIEVEDLGESPSPRLSAGSDSVRVDRRSFAIGHIINKIKDREMDLPPPLSRSSGWKRLHKVRLIESALLRIPFPPLYFSVDRGGAMRIVHGFTHLSVVNEFVAGGFALDSDKLTYLSDEPGVSGETFSHLAPLWKRRILNARAVSYILKPALPLPVSFDIVQRLHTGFDSLNAQEIRHLLCGKTARAFLADLVESRPFRETTQGVFYRHIRQADLQIVLRFCAFRMLSDWKEYEAAASMDLFLAEALEKIDQQLSPEQRMALQADLDRAMENARALFGEHAFRKWPLGDHRVYPINRALLESLAVALAGYDPADLEAHRPAIVSELRRRMRDDHAYIDAITGATFDTAKVKLRFRAAQAIAAVRAR